MKRLLSIVALVSLSGLGMTLSAQDTQSAPAPSQPQQTQTDAGNSQQAARSFEGKIAKAGDQLVLQESSTQTAYKLDDQDKAKQFEGKDVKVMATVDSSTNTLHVVDITPASR
jgi:Ni/Co efflux regulator RcnB